MFCEQFSPDLIQRKRTFDICSVLVGQREQYNTLGHFVLTQLDWVCYRWVLQQVLYVMRLSPYLYFILPVNKRLNFEILLRLGAFLSVAGAVVIQSRHGSR